MSETFKQPDNFYRCRQMFVNLSKLTDVELDRFAQIHETRTAEIIDEYAQASAAINKEKQERGLMDQQVLEFFGAMAVGHDN